MNKIILLAAALVISVGIQSAYADNKPAGQGKGKADAAAVDTACAADAKATGCSGMVVGKGLLKCMHKYKQENKDYKFSEGCKDAMKDLKEDVQEAKQKKQNRQ